MINNRQGGRRRGRGGQRPQGAQGNAGGNARDNRQRGNAAQLLEKYKSMARDAQLAGDRVQTEYYLQFADHYFRVLEEGRSRFEDQQQQQGRRRQRDDDNFDGEDEDGLNVGEMDGGDQGGDDGDDGDDEADQRSQRPPQQQQRQEQQRPHRHRNPDAVRREPANEAQRGDRDGIGDSRDERIPHGVLPPAIGAAGDDDNGEAEAPRPRRRARRIVAEDDGDIAPAA